MANSLVEAIRDQIKNKISALATVNKVYDYERVNPQGFPAVFITATDVEGEFWSTAENRRVYAFRIMVLESIGADLKGVTNDRMSNAENLVMEVVEDILNALDTDYELGQFNTEVLFLDAVDSTYGYVEFDGGWAKSAELVVRIHADKNIT